METLTVDMLLVQSTTKATEQDTLITGIDGQESGIGQDDK